jgi:hypothetical protein
VESEGGITVFEFTNLFDKWLDNLDPEDFFCLLMNAQKIVRPETFEEVRYQPGMFLYRVFGAVDQRLQRSSKFIEDTHTD